MPFESKAQARAAFGGYLGPEMKSKAEEFARSTPNMKNLPEHVKKMHKKTIVKNAVSKYSGKGGIGDVYNGIKDVVGKVGRGVGKYIDYQLHPLKYLPDTTESDNMKKGIMDAARKASYPHFDITAPLKTSMPLKIQSPTNSVPPLKPKNQMLKKKVTGLV